MLLSRIKGNIIKLVTKIFANSNIIGSPAKVSDAYKWHVNNINESSWHEISKEERIKEILPNFIEHAISDKHKKALERNTSSTFVLKLKNAKVWGARGAVVTKDDTFLSDVSREFGKEPREHSIFNTLKLKKPKYINGNVAVLSTAGSNVYYHWLFDVLPRIKLLQLSGLYKEIDYFILDYQELKFQKETLAILNISESKILRSNNNWDFCVRAKSLYVPSLVNKINGINKLECEFLKENFLLNSSGDIKRNRKIYISREKAGNRHLVNEDEIYAYLSEFGFEKVFTEDLSFIEQVNLFAQSTFIIAPHGSSLSNTVFCSSETMVIDIMPESNINICFWVLANNLKINYWYIIGKPVAINGNVQHDNIFLPIEKLKKIIQNSPLNERDENLHQDSYGY